MVMQDIVTSAFDALGLIPLYAVGISAAFVVFECIGQCGSVASEGEVVRGVGRQDDGATHVEAVEVALQ